MEVTLFCFVAFHCWHQRQGLAPEQHPGVPGHQSSTSEGVGSVLVRPIVGTPMGVAHCGSKQGNTSPITGSQPHLHPGMSTEHCGLSGGSHFSHGSPLTSFVPCEQLSRDLDITTSNFTTNVYKGLIYTLQQCKYLYNLQNNLNTLIPLVRIKLGGQELDHGLKLNIPPKRDN